VANKWRGCGISVADEDGRQKTGKEAGVRRRGVGSRKNIFHFPFEIYHFSIDSERNFKVRALVDVCFN